MISQLLPYLGLYNGDLDSINQNCFLISTVDSTNNPNLITGGDYSFVINFYISNTYGAQIAFGFGEDNIAIRRKNGTSTYTEWTAI